MASCAKAQPDIAKPNFSGRQANPYTAVSCFDIRMHGSGYSTSSIRVGYGPVSRSSKARACSSVSCVSR